MAQQTIGVGTVANDNTGDPIRDAFVKVNANFDEIYATGMTDGDLLVQTDGTNLTEIGVDGAITNADITLQPNGTGKVILASTTTRVVDTLSTPASNVGVAGDKVGDIAIDATYLYICVRDYDAGADAWLRSAIFTTF